ncbi:pyridoxal-phosphate dependent enzyme [Frankia sp. AiPa1]|uniref:pyridoxal-phosphate dependent enzyme n=1 Tax=Frankia sp. AiPa1 TaxID=573492 RepID=UPI0035A8AB06
MTRPRAVEAATLPPAAEVRGPTVADVARLASEVEAAARVLGGVAARTRVVRDADLSAELGVPVWLKCEQEQHTGSFKLRGAYHRVALADSRARARGVVAASAGNHAQGVAYAAAAFGVPATIFVPAGANPVKVARTRRLGARVEEVPGGVEAALAAAARFAAEGGRLLVHPFDDPSVIAGQGTIGLELLDQVPDVRTVLVGVGGGGLVSGLAVALRARRPGIRVIGVQSELAPAFATALRTGRRPPTTDLRTIADGMAVREPGRLPLALALSLVDARSLVDDVVTVDEDAFWSAMVRLYRSGLVVEPAGAAAVAALLRHGELAEGTTVAVLSGGNIDPAVAARVETLAATPGRTRTTAGTARRVRPDRHPHRVV